jgi:hypothetical protein
MDYSYRIIQTDKTNESPPSYKTQSGPKPWSLLLGKLEDNLVVANGYELAIIDSVSNRIWNKQLICPGMPNKICISGKRMMVSTRTENYHSWGFLGPMILVNLEDGEIIKVLKGEEAAAFSGGRFIVGLEGYDYFHSWLYNSEGDIIQTWRSYGHYIISDNSIRVIEKHRMIPTNSHIVRLDLNGEIEKGTKLFSYETSEPIIFQNENFIFVNSGKLLVINSGLESILTLTLLNISENESSRFSSKVSFHNNRIDVDIYERSKEERTQYLRYHWLIEIDQNII